MRPQKLPPPEHVDVAGYRPKARASLQSRVVGDVTAVTLRPLTAVLPANRLGVLAARRVLATGLAVLGPPLPGSRIIRIQRPANPAPGVRGEWVRARGAGREDAVILYVHGSGYALCSARTHRGITTRLSAATGLPVFACDYRLAPRHRFPCAADDVRAAYEWLLGEGHDPARIVVAGDSAGGHLAIDLTLQLLHERRIPPAALSLFSPVLDMGMSLAAARERMQPDPMISAARAARLFDVYLADTGRRDPRVSFAFDGAEAFPPTFVQAAQREMLAADAIELARSLRTAGASCELEIWPGQVHVFQALNRVIPEAEAALRRAGDFVVEQLEIAGNRARLGLVREA